MTALIFFLLLSFFYVLGLAIAVLLDRRRGVKTPVWELLFDIGFGSYLPSYVQFPITTTMSRFTKEIVDIVNKYLSGVVFAVYLLLGFVVSVYLVGWL